MTQSRTDRRAGEYDSAQLQALAKRHLWMHFSRLGAYRDRDVPMFVRGSGVRLFDSGGRAFLD